MGNTITKQIKIDNFVKFPNDLKIAPVNTQMDKEACELEKGGLKLVSKHNLELKDKNLLINAILDHFLLRALDNRSVIEIIKEMSLYYAKKGKTIFKQGAPSGMFYVLRQGSVNLILNGEIKQVIKKSGVFGDTSLIYNTDRDYTITTLEECFMWTIEKRNFKKILEYITNITYDDTNKSVNNLPLFKIIDIGEKSKIIKDFYRETHIPGRPIYIKGQISNCIYIIKDGFVDIKDGKKVVKTLKEGDYFGDLSVIGLTNRIMDAEAKEKTHLYSISVSNLEKILGENFRTNYMLSLIKIAFFKTENFKNLNFDFLDEIMQFFKFRFYSKQTEILINQTIKKVTEDLSSIKYNTAVSALMILLNELEKLDTVSKKDYRVLLHLLNPIAPHITEELNEIYNLGNKFTESTWVEYDTNKLEDKTYTMVVQVNGKVRGKIEVDTNTTEEEMKKWSLEIENVKVFTEGKEIVKMIVVPKKLVNIVVK